MKKQMHYFRTGLLAVLLAVAAGPLAAQTNAAAAAGDNGGSGQITDAAGFFKLMNGTWKKTRQWRTLRQGKLVIDAAAGEIKGDFTRYGTVRWKITGFSVDRSTGIDRFVLKVRSRLGSGEITVLFFSAKTVYLGHSGLGRIVLWGTYHPE